MWNEGNCKIILMLFCIAFLWDWNENCPFPVLWPLLSFPVCWHIECSTLTASFFRIWDSSAGITPHPLALVLVRLPKAHLTSHFRMSGSRWVTTPLCLSGSLRAFLYRYSGYSCHLSLISSASVRFLPFLSSLVSIFAWSIPLVSPVFLKISLVFPFLLFSSISLYCSLKKAFSFLIIYGTLHSVGYIFSWSSAFHFSSFLRYL